MLRNWSFFDTGRHCGQRLLGKGAGEEEEKNKKEEKEKEGKKNREGRRMTNSNLTQI